jgi:hypothetical protein
VAFAGTPIKHICSKLIDSVWKPLTKDEIRDLIDGLEIRNTKYMVDNNLTSRNTVSRLSQLNILINGLVTDGIETNSFTSLLDNLIRQKPNFFF